MADVVHALRSIGALGAAVAVSFTMAAFQIIRATAGAKMRVAIGQTNIGPRCRVRRRKIESRMLTNLMHALQPIVAFAAVVAVAFSRPACCRSFTRMVVAEFQANIAPCVHSKVGAHIVNAKCTVITLVVAVAVALVFIAIAVSAIPIISIVEAALVVIVPRGPLVVAFREAPRNIVAAVAEGSVPRTTLQMARSTQLASFSRTQQPLELVVEVVNEVVADVLGFVAARSEQAPACGAIDFAISRDFDLELLRFL